MNKKLSCLMILLMIFTLVFTGCIQKNGQPVVNKLGVALSSEMFNTIEDIQSTISIDKQNTTGINNLGYELTKNIYNNEKENIIFSPLSLSCAMAMLADGAEGDTKQEIIDVLGADPSNYNTAYNQVINQLNSYSEKKETNDGKKVETSLINIANSAWFNKDLKIHQNYVDQLKKYYNADSMNVDFNDVKTKDIMNKWIEEKTKNLLKDTIDETSDDNAAFLINTLYFKGTWKNQFDKKDTKEKVFKLENGSEVKVDMMYGNLNKEYYEDSDCQIIKLDYYDTAMYVILPKQELESFIKSEKYNTLDKTIAKMVNTNVDIHFPKFKYKNSTMLNDYLKDIGMIKAFDADKAEFKNICDANIFLSKAFQNAAIEVDENGTEAAAVTVLEMEYTSMPAEGNTVFNCDKPFLYLIKDNKTGINLFMGMVNDPTK